jgi:hypothetical protein
MIGSRSAGDFQRVVPEAQKQLPGPQSGSSPVQGLDACFVEEMSVKAAAASVMSQIEIPRR